MQTNHSQVISEQSVYEEALRNKAIVTSLLALRSNPQYQSLVEELKSRKVALESKLFSESLRMTDELLYSQKTMLIEQINMLREFIELPDTMLQRYDV